MPGVRIVGLLIALSAGPVLASSGLDGAERVTLHSSILGEDRVLAVVTPASYARGRARYPVLYLTDGDANIGHLRATAEFLARNDLMPELILVGILNTARTRDLTPTPGNEADHAGSPTGGGGERFLDFIEKELIPAIDTRYRTVPLRIHAGHSFGGLLALHAMLTRPGLFQAVLASSPYLPWDDELMLRQARAMLPDTPLPPRALYVSVGEREAPRGVRDGYQRLAQAMQMLSWKDFRFVWQVIPDEDHGSVVLPAYYAGLRHVFAGWHLPRQDQPLSLASLRAHYQKLSQSWGVAISPPEQLVNLLGYAALQQDDRKGAIEIFRFNVSLHPDSANVYDSLAEALEKDGQLAAALESSRRAVQLAEKTGDPLLVPLRQHLEHLEKRTGALPAPAGHAT